MTSVDGARRRLLPDVMSSSVTDRKLAISTDDDHHHQTTQAPTPYVQLVLNRIRSSRRATLNVGGVRHEVMWSALERLPRTRLGRLRHATTVDEISQLCDDFRLIGGGNDVTREEEVEFFFDRHARSFGSVLNFYRTGERKTSTKLLILQFSRQKLCKDYIILHFN